MKHRITPSIISVSAILALGATAATADEVLVGIQLPLTGPIASFAGPPLKAGVELALERIEKSNFLGDGRKLKVLIEDDAADKNQAISLTNRFVTRDHVSILLGPPTTVLASAAAPVANSLDTPILTIAVADVVTQVGPWVYKLYMSPDAAMTAVGQYATDKLKVKKVALVYDRANDASVAQKNVFKDYVTKKGVEIVAEETTQVGETNFAPMATKLASLAPDALFLATTAEVGANIVIQSRRAGLADSVKILGNNNFSTPAYARTGGKAVDGTIYPADYFAGLPTEENKAFVEAFRKLTGKEPDSFSAAAYVGLMVVAQAVKDAGPGADKAKIKEALSRVKDLPTVFGRGKFSIDANRSGAYEIALVKLANGNPELAD
ncbi:MAG: ABC transporter substrate-binding protein [Xanthobacteraceae bacterium]